MVIIWKALIEYVGNNIKAGRSVNIKKFGAFTFNCETELPKIHMRSGSPTVDIWTQREERKNIHHLKPVFVVDPELQYHLVRYPGKEEISPSISQHSIYQKGFRTIYANPVPVAAAAMLGKDVVVDTLRTIFLAIHDLIKYDKNIDLAFGFCNVRCNHRNLSTVFANNLSSSIGNAKFENMMTRQTSPVSDLWRTTYRQKWADSTLSTLVMKPNNDVC